MLSQWAFNFNTILWANSAVDWACPGKVWLGKLTGLTSVTLTVDWAVKPQLKQSADDRLVIFFLFFPKIGFDISCKLSSSIGDNLPEMSNPVLGKIRKIFQNVC